MQILDGRLLLSATDLVNFLGCRHATYLEMRDLTDPVELPDATVLIFEKGIEHEKRYLASLKARDVSVVEVPGEGFDLPERTAQTREAMRAGAEVIYQAALVVPPWLGYADFLERAAEASTLGFWSYEALDTKLPRRAKPEHVIQLTSYSRLIGSEQGCTPAQMHVQLGNNERVSLRVADFIHYHSIAQRRLEAFAQQPPEISTAERCNHCRICRWSSRCEAGWAVADHLTRVAHITRHQIRRLWEGGISTVRALAALPAGSRVPGIQPDTLDPAGKRHCRPPNAIPTAITSRHCPSSRGRVSPASRIPTPGTFSSIWRALSSSRTAASNTSLALSQSMMANRDLPRIGRMIERPKNAPSKPRWTSLRRGWRRIPAPSFTTTPITRRVRSNASPWSTGREKPNWTTCCGAGGSWISTRSSTKASGSPNPATR